MADVSDASRSTATRRTRGATSLSSSSHFALIPYSNGVNPVTSGAQVFPPARATVLPSLRESSSRVSSLLACYALGPLASAAQYSCRREPCTGRSAWLLLGRACLSAWIEHRSGEPHSP